MREVKICTNSSDTLVVIALVMLVACICAGVMYYYRGAGGEIERELSNLEQLNSQLASETRQLQTGIASHGAGINTVRGKISKSRKRIEHVYSDLEKAGGDADRAIKIIAECQNIIETVKTQR